MGQGIRALPDINQGCRADTKQGCRADTKQGCRADTKQGCRADTKQGCRADTKQGCRAVQGCCPLEMAVAVVVAVEGVGSYCNSGTM